MIIPELVAHRGYARHYPENTLVGLEAAVHAGARYIEVDVQLTADRLPVLFHDRTLERVCGVRGAIHDHTLAQLTDLRASEFDRFGYCFAQNPLARLADLAGLLTRHPTVTAFVEVKRVAIARFGVPNVLAAITDVLAPVAERCVLISFSPELLLAARAQMQTVRTGWNALGAVIETWADRRRDWMVRLRPQFVFCDVQALPRFGRLTIPGARLVVYEIDDAATALRLAQRGAAFIETFAVGELRPAIALARGDET